MGANIVDCRLLTDPRSMVCFICSLAMLRPTCFCLCYLWTPLPWQHSHLLGPQVPWHWWVPGWLPNEVTSMGWLPWGDTSCPGYVYLMWRRLDEESGTFSHLVCWYTFNTHCWHLWKCSYRWENNINNNIFSFNHNYEVTYCCNVLATSGCLLHESRWGDETSQPHGRQLTIRCLRIQLQLCSHVYQPRSYSVATITTLFLLSDSHLEIHWW